MPRLKILLGAAAVSLLSAGALHAFPNTIHWTADASGPLCGAGGIYATGASADWGVTCAHCHINDKGQQGKMAVSVTANPVMGGGKYVPGTVYTMTVQILNEALGLANAIDNKNGFVLTVEDAGGKKAGTLTADMTAGCPAAAPLIPDGAVPGTTYTYGDCRAITSIGKNNVAPKWTFTWKAPAAGTGTVTMFYGVLDGDSSQTSLGDDLKLGTLRLNEGP